MKVRLFFLLGVLLGTCRAYSQSVDDYFKPQENAVTNTYNPVYIRYFSPSGTAVKQFYDETRVKEIDALLQQYAQPSFPDKALVERDGPWRSIVKAGIRYIPEQKNLFTSDGVNDQQWDLFAKSVGNKTKYPVYVFIVDLRQVRVSFASTKSSKKMSKAELGKMLDNLKQVDNPVSSESKDAYVNQNIDGFVESLGNLYGRSPAVLSERNFKGLTLGISAKLVKHIPVSQAILVTQFIYYKDQEATGSQAGQGKAPAAPKIMLTSSIAVNVKSPGKKPDEYIQAFNKVGTTMEFQELLSSVYGKEQQNASKMDWPLYRATLRILTQTITAEYSRSRGLNAGDPVPDVLANANGTFSFITPAGTQITLPATVYRPYFFQRVANEERKIVTPLHARIVAGTLAGFFQGGKQYAAAFDGDNFLGYKAGDVAFEPVDFTAPDVILGLVCTEGFNYIKFNTSLPGSLPRQVNLPRPVVDEAMFPIVPFSDNAKMLKAVKADHAALTCKTLADEERPIVEDLCEKPELIPLLKLSELAAIYPVSYEAFAGSLLNMLKVDTWNTFVAIAGDREGDMKVLPKKTWLLKVDSDPELQKLFNNDKYRFYSRTLAEFQKVMEEFALPSALVENGLLTFLTPAGTTISLPKTAKKLSFFETIGSDAEDAIIPGCLMSFEVDDVLYEAQLLSGSFVGYTSGKSFYEPQAQGTSANVILGLPGKYPSGIAFRLVKFNIPGLKRHAARGGVIQDVLDFVPLYTFDTPPVGEAVFTSGQLAEQSFVLSTLTYSDLQERVIEKYGTKPELLTAYKAAQLGTKYVVLLEVYTQFFDEWERATMPAMNQWDDLVYRSGINTSAPVNYARLWKDNKRGFYAEFIKSFRYEIKRWATFNKGNFLARLDDPDYLSKILHWDVTLALDKFTEADCKALNGEQRIKILRLLTRSELVGGTYEAPEALQMLPVPIAFSLKGSETVALQIVQSTPPEQRRYILDQLMLVPVGREKGDRRLLLHALSEDFDGLEFERFMISIAEWVEQTIAKPENPENYYFTALQKGLAFPLHPGLWDGAPVSKSFSDDGTKVLLHTEDTKVVGWKEVSGNRDGYFIQEIRETTEYNVAAGPYEYIVVLFKDNFKLSDSKTFRKGEKALMPAIFGYMIFNRMNANRLQRAGKYGVDIALVALGGAGLIAEWRTISAAAKIKGIFDLGLGVGSIVIYDGELDARLKKSKAGLEFLQLWEELQICSSVADAAEMAGKLHELVEEELKDPIKNLWLSDEDRKTLQVAMGSIDREFTGVSPSVPGAPVVKYARLEERLQNMAIAERAEFDKIFSEKPAHLERFDGNPALVDGWLVIKNDPKLAAKVLNGVADADFADVQHIADYIGKNPQLRASLAAELDALSPNVPGDWTAGLAQFAGLKAVEEKLATLKPELRSVFRRMYGGGDYTDMLTAVAQRPAMIDAWQVLQGNTLKGSDLIKGASADVRGYLEKVADYVDDTKRSVDDVIGEFKAINTLDKQKAWIANLARAAGSSFARFEGNTFRWLQTLEVDQKVITTQNNASGMVVFFNTEGVAARIGEVSTAGPAKFHIDPAAAELQNYSGYNLKYVKEEIDVTLNGVDIPKTDVGIVCKSGKCSVIPGACFTGGTPVHTVKGLKPIESIKAGDSVYAYNGKSKSRTVQPVMRTFTRAFTRLVKVFAGKDTLTTTTNHPFFADNVWTPARSLKKGSRILLLSGMLSSVDSVAMIDSLATVYNFEVAGDHDYYVGTEGFLVHNASGGLCDILKESPYTGIALKNDALRKLAVLPEPHQRRILDFIAGHTDAADLLSDYPHHIAAFEEFWDQFGDKSKFKEVVAEVPAAKVDEFVKDTKSIKDQRARLEADPSLVKKYVRATHWKRFKFQDMDAGISFETFAVEVDPKFIYHDLGNGYTLKYDPDKGRALLVKITTDPATDEVLDFMLDEDHYVASQGIDAVAHNMKTIYGLPGGKTEITLKGKVIKLDPDKTNLLLGRYDPKVKGQTSTQEVFKELTMFKTRNFAARKGGVQMLNIPTNIGNGASDWWKVFNAPYLDDMLKHDVKIVMVTDPTLGQILVNGSSFTTYGNEMIALAESGKLDFYFDTNDNWSKFVKKGTSPFQSIDLEILTRKIPPDEIAALLDNFNAVFGDTRIMFDFLKGIAPGKHSNILTVVRAGKNQAHLQGMHSQGLKLRAVDGNISIAVLSEEIGRLSDAGVDVKKWAPGGAEKSKIIGEFILIQAPDGSYGFVTTAFNRKFKKLSDADKTMFIDDFKGKLQSEIEELVGKKELKLYTQWVFMKKSPLRADMKNLRFSYNFPTTWRCEYVGGVTEIYDGDNRLVAKMTATRLEGVGGVQIDKDWNPVLSYKPMENHVYVVTSTKGPQYNIAYETDGMGRVTKASGDMYEFDRGRNDYQQGVCVELKDGTKGKDQGGHIFAASTFGPGEQINYVAWDGNSNMNGDWRKMEQKVMDLIRTHGHVHTTITFNYGTSLRPLSAEVTVLAPNGTQLYKTPSPIMNP